MAVRERTREEENRHMLDNINERKQQEY